MIAAASSMIAASANSISRKPTRTVAGNLRAARIGGTTALSAPIAAAATSAPSKPGTDTPGRIHAASSSEAALSTHETTRCSGRTRSRCGLQGLSSSTSPMTP